MPEITLEAVKSLYLINNSTHDISHIIRVTNLAEEIARKEGGDARITRTASLLHDISRTKPNHHLEAANRVKRLLGGEPESFINAVIHCIESHTFDEPPFPDTIEAKCLSDADKLDTLGAIGIARTFAVAGAQNNQLWVAPLDELRTEIGDQKRTYREKWRGTKNYTPSHEFLCKMERISLEMQTDTGRKFSVERYKYMKDFFERLDSEALGIS